MTNKELDAKINVLKDEIFKLEKKKVVAKSNKIFTCKAKGCGKKSQLGKCDRLDSYYLEDCPYTPRYNYSETGIICPHCRVNHRLLGEENKDKYYLWDEEEYNAFYKEYSGSGCATYTKVDFTKEGRYGDPEENDVKCPFREKGYLDFVIL